MYEHKYIHTYTVHTHTYMDEVFPPIWASSKAEMFADATLSITDKDEAVIYTHTHTHTYIYTCIGIHSVKQNCW